MRIFYLKLALLLLLFGLLTDNKILCQQDSVLIIKRVNSGDITLDGVIDEEVWEHIVPVPLVQYSPDPGSPPTEKTEIRFAYDDKYFYGSIKAYDSDPDGIRGNSLYRDRLAGSDHFEILLDSYNDNETAFIFNTISTGVRTDAAISNDATGGTISSSSWFNGSFNTFWDTEVTRDENGWYAETRIPFSSLRFQNVDGKVIMGLSVQRKIARKLERLVFPAIGPIIDWAFLKPSLAQKIQLEGITPSKKIYLTPYVLTSYERIPRLNDEASGYEYDHEFDLNVGGDIKYSLTNNVTLDLTVNTDFAQVEADDQLVNLTRFSLFFPEKRQFFQERSAVFDFRTGGLSRVFFSRRIGLRDDGTPVPILGGARIVGRRNDWDFGILNMQSRSYEDIGTENFGVIRVKRRAFNQNSTLGGIFTSRIGDNGKRNYVYGIDGLIRIVGDDFLTINWSQSFNENDEQPSEVDGLNNGRLTIELNRRRRRGFGYNLGAIYSGEAYTPRLGFVDRQNFKFGTATLSHTWLYPEGSSLFLQSIGFKGLGYFDNEDNDLLSAAIGSVWSFTTKSLDNGNLAVTWRRENLDDQFSLSRNSSIPAGEYDFVRIYGSYRMAGEKILRAGLETETGTFYDGWLTTIAFSPSWFVSRHLELSLQYVYNNLRFKDRKVFDHIHIARLRIGTAINSKISTNAFIQYSSDADLLSANIRFRYNLREGTDLWIVFNEGINTDRFSTTPRLPGINNESFQIKYLHTFL